MQLDAEMEKVFAGPGGTRDTRPDKFDVAQLVGDTDTKDRDPQRFKEYDSDCKCLHKSLLCPFVHMILFG